MVADIVMPTRASNIGATVKEESRWNRPNPTENAPAVATSAVNGWPTTKPQTRTITIAGTQHAAATTRNSSRCSFMTSPVAAIISRRCEYSFASSIGTGSLHGAAGRDPKRQVRTPAGPTAAPFRRPRPSSIPRKIRPASPPPVASSPDPARAVPDPGSGHPHRMDKGGHDVCAWHPDILNAVPAPVTRLPDITGSRWRGTTSTTGAGGAKPTTTPTRATPGPATSVRAAAQRMGRIDRRLICGFREISRRPNRLSDGGWIGP